MNAPNTMTPRIALITTRAIAMMAACEPRRIILNCRPVMRTHPGLRKVVNLPMGANFAVLGSIIVLPVSINPMIGL